MAQLKSESRACDLAIPRARLRQHYNSLGSSGAFHPKLTLMVISHYRVPAKGPYQQAKAMGAPQLNTATVPIECTSDAAAARPRSRSHGQRNGPTRDHGDPGDVARLMPGCASLGSRIRIDARLVQF